MSSFIHSLTRTLCVLISWGKNREREKVEKVNDITDTYKNQEANITINI